MIKQGKILLDFLPGTPLFELKSFPMRLKGWLSFTFGLMVAAVFLYLTFRGVDLKALWSHLARVGWLPVLFLLAINAISLLSRSLRWYLLLPERRGEFWRTTRALALSYGVSNVVSRLGELVRIVVLARDSKRSAATLTATVMVDRLVFDLGAFAVMFTVILFGFRGEVAEYFPGIAAAFPAFAGMLITGFLALVFAAFLPAQQRMRITRFFLGRWPKLLEKVDGLFDRLHAGLETISSPGKLLAPMAANLLVWSIAFAFFALSLNLFGLDLSFQSLLLAFCVATVGLLVPSPGGVGTVHYFLSAALVHFADVEPVRATAAATFCHGIGFLSTSIFAVIFWFTRVRTNLEGDQEHQPQDVDL